MVLGVFGDIPTDTPKQSGLYWETLGNDGSKKPRSARHTGLFWETLGDAGKLSGPPDRNRTCI